MSPGATAEDRAPRGHHETSSRWTYVLLGFGIFLVGLSAWQPVPAGVWHDDGVYMLIGQSLADGHGLRYSGVVGSPPAAKFPPLYPTLLASLWWLLGSIGPVTLAATVLNLAFLAVAGALFAKVLHTRVELPLGVSILATAVGFASTDLIRTALVPLSEPLFLLFTVGSLAVWRAEPAAEKRATILLASLLVAAVATRTAGAALVGAFAVSLGYRTGVRSALWTTAPALIAAGAWGLWTNRAANAIPDGLRDLLGPYGGWLVDQTVAAPLAFFTGLPAHASGVSGRIAALLIPGLAGAWLSVAAVPLAALAAFGLWRLSQRSPPMAWFVLAYFVMLLLWPYLDRRLVAPLHPFIVAAIVLGALGTVDRLAGRPHVRQAFVGLFLVWVGSFTLVTAGRIATGWPAAPYRLRAEQLATAVEALNQTVPPDATVGAAEFWAALHLHGGWQVSPSARFDPRSVDPSAPMWGTPDEQHALWRTTGIDYLLLEQGGTLHGAALDALELRCPDTVFILARMPPLAVVQLAWDTPCDDPVP